MYSFPLNRTTVTTHTHKLPPNWTNKQRSSCITQASYPCLFTAYLAIPAPYIGPSSISYWCLFSFLAVLRLFCLHLTVADVMASALNILSISVSLITSTVTTVVWSHNLSIAVSLAEAPSLKVEMAILAAASTLLFPIKIPCPYDEVEALVSMLHALKQAVTWHVVVHWNKLLPHFTC